MTAPVLRVIGRIECPRCGALVRQVRTPWGTDAPVEDEAVGAYDSAAGTARIVVVHPEGISRCVRPTSEWSGPVVRGWELHTCRGKT